MLLLTGSESGGHAASLAVVLVLMLIILSVWDAWGVQRQR
jgi:hypothetical protein